MNKLRTIVALLLGVISVYTQNVCAMDECQILQESNTQLMSAASSGNLQLVRELKRDQIKRRDAVGWTALMCAACYGHVECVKELLEEANIQNDYGHTALMLACRDNCPRCVELLLDEEAETKDKDGCTAFSYANANNHAECVELITNHLEKLRAKINSVLNELPVIHEEMQNIQRKIKATQEEVEYLKADNEKLIRFMIEVSQEV